MSWRRSLYSALTWLALPLVPLRLWQRGRREPGYRAHQSERYGCYGSALEPVAIWIHAVSAGETRAAAPLVRALQKRLPRSRILLTHMTATGREAGRALFGTGVHQAYAPYDFAFAVRGFLRHFRPQLALVMETELWPNLITLTADAAIPIYLVNARLSPRSAARYRRWGGFTGEVLAALSGVGAQSETDAQRLRALGARNVQVTGSMKFDLDVPPEMLTQGRALRERLGRERPVWLAAVTRDGEEALFLDALPSLSREVLTLIVPRHPQRFDAVAQLLHDRGIAFQRKSEGREIALGTQVMLGDTMGEMYVYYAAADVAYIGGSLLPLGGQNLLEACAVGTPVILGPHTFNFAQASEHALAAGAALRAQNAQEVLAMVAQLLADPARRTRMGEAGRAFYARHRGATQHTLALIEPVLDAFSRSPASG